VELLPHIEAIRDDVAQLLASDESALDAFARLHRAMDASVQLRLLDAIGEAAQELSTQLPAGQVDLRLAGRDAQLVYVGASEAPASQSFLADDEEDAGTARLTLRLPESLKSKVEEAAGRGGLSVNAWLVRVVDRGVNPPVFGADVRQTRSGSRIKGYAQS
jgi:hypothetical protein